MPHRSRDREDVGELPRERHPLEFPRHGEGQRPVGTTVQRIWRAFGLRPRRLETFKLSTDPYFVAKVRDVVGLYVSPLEHAIVLCVDEKSQIQALDGSQPMLPMRPGQPARRGDH